MVEFWHWFVVALALGVVEIFAPTAFIIWLAGAAAAVGVALLVWPAMGGEYQFLLFAMISIAGVVIARFLFRRQEHAADGLHLNRRAEQYIGTLHTLETDIVNGHGRAQVGDSHWAVEGPDLPSGTRVRVTGVNGVVLKVERAPLPQDAGEG